MSFVLSFLGFLKYFFLYLALKESSLETIAFFYFGLKSLFYFFLTSQKTPSLSSETPFVYNRPKVSWIEITLLPFSLLLQTYALLAALKNEALFLALIPYSSYPFFSTLALRVWAKKRWKKSSLLWLYLLTLTLLIFILKPLSLTLPITLLALGGGALKGLSWILMKKTSEALSPLPLHFTTTLIPFILSGFLPIFFWNSFPKIPVLWLLGVFILELLSAYFSKKVLSKGWILIIPLWALWIHPPCGIKIAEGVIVLLALWGLLKEESVIPKPFASI